MSDKRAPSITPPNQAYPREEMEAMVDKWLQANVDAEKEGDWTRHLGPMYTEDAVYTWNIGPDEEFVADGRQEICDVALGYQMVGFEGWEYPYHDIIIDDRRGTVLGFWKQQSPYTRPDGTPMCIEVSCELLPPLIPEPVLRYCSSNLAQPRRSERRSILSY